ncbi:hypothetical protein [Vibrio owensii]|uniref:hypothetical protein n=1 Tax=Vibrio owensii TaxID=696485 RepID=UPI0038CE3296
MELIKKRNKALSLTSQREKEISIERKRLTDLWHSEVKHYFESNDFQCKRESMSHWIANKLYLGEQTTANYNGHAEFAFFTPDPFIGVGQVTTTQGLWLFELVNPLGESLELKLKVEIDNKEKSLDRIIDKLKRTVPYRLLDYKFKFYKYDKNKSWTSQEQQFQIANDLQQFLTSIILQPQ